MIVRDETHDRCFTVLHNRIPEDARLSLQAKGLLWYLLTKPKTWKIYKKQLKQALGVKRCTFDSAFEELVECGYIRQENGAWNVFETPKDPNNKDVVKQHDVAGLHISVAPDSISNAAPHQQRCRQTASNDVAGQHLVRTEAVSTESKERRRKTECAPPLSSSCFKGNEKKLSNFLIHARRELRNYYGQWHEFPDEDLSKMMGQAQEILKQYPPIPTYCPSSKQTSQVIFSIMRAIHEYTYEAILVAVQNYDGTAWPNYFFGEGEEHYRDYLPDNWSSAPAQEDSTVEVLSLEQLTEQSTRQEAANQMIILKNNALREKQAQWHKEQEELRLNLSNIHNLKENAETTKSTIEPSEMKERVHSNKTGVRISREEALAFLNK